MYLIDVIPIGKEASFKSFSYWHKKEIKAGALVEAPIRGKLKFCLALSSKEAASSKIRKATFKMRKIGKIIKENFYSKDFIAAAKETANYYASPLGATLNALTPKAILENAVKEDGVGFFAPEEKKDFQKRKHYKAAILSPDSERLNIYKNTIRESFARNQSIIFSFPTIPDAERSMAFLSKGIGNYCLVLHSKIPKKKLREDLAEKIKSAHPLAIFATPAFLGCRLFDVGTIVCENESSVFYSSESRPFINTSFFAEKLAEKIGAKFILADSLLRTENFFRMNRGEILEENPALRSFILGKTKKIIDMRNYRFNAPKQKFEVLSDELKALVKKVQTEQSRLFILVGRKGYSSTVACGDCGETLVCPKCKMPERLQTAGGKRVFVCPRCAKIESAEKRCPVCQSWKLVPLGIGAERVFEEVSAIFPPETIFIADANKDAAATSGEIMTKFFAAKPGILIGTEATLNRLGETVPYAAIASIDSLLSLPNLRSNERAALIINRLYANTLKELLIQTRKPDNAAIKYAETGNVSEFYKAELLDREALGYPPFKTLVKISLSGSENRLGTDMAAAKKNLSPFEFEVYPASKNARGKATLCGLCRLEPSSWPNRELLQKLAALPQSFNIEVNPDKLV